MLLLECFLTFDFLHMQQKKNPTQELLFDIFYFHFYTINPQADSLLFAAVLLLLQPVRRGGRPGRSPIGGLR